jgi:hypothetical protein
VVCEGIVGEMDENGDGNYIWTHKKLDIGYNGQQIVDVNLTSEAKVKLTTTGKISFSYEVNWRPSAVKFADRFDKYLDPNFFQHRVSLDGCKLSASVLYCGVEVCLHYAVCCMLFRSTGSPSSTHS